MACSARQLVASIDGSHKKRNTAGNSLAKCLAKRSASANGGGVSISRPSRDELRAVRDAHAARCGYDVEKIFRDIRATQQASGREYVRLPARRVRSDAATP